MSAPKIAFLTFLITNLIFSVPARSDLVWGANGHPLNSYPGMTIEQQLDYLHDLGMKSYRVDIVSAEKAAELAKLVKAGKIRGIEILPVITPDLDLKKEDASVLYKKAYDLAVTLVSRFKNDIRVWELGNEMENHAIIQPCEMQDDGVQYNCAWGPAGGEGVLEYYGPRWAKVSAVLKGLSDGTISVDPTILKAMGTAGWGHKGAFDRMQNDGIKWDISIWHMYGQDPEPAFKFLSKFDRPIWVTEFNHPDGSRPGEQEQAAGLKHWMERLRQLQGKYKVEAAHIYELMDESYWAPDYEGYMGLVHMRKTSEGGWAAGTPKPAYSSVRSVIRGKHAQICKSPYIAAEKNAGSTSAKGAPAAVASVAAFARKPDICRRCSLSLLGTRMANYPNQVEYSYCLTIGRYADGAGLASWVDALKKGMSFHTMLMHMLTSAEFNKMYVTSKTSNSDYVHLIYRLLFGRDPDGAGRSGYLSQLDQRKITRPDLISAMINSSEFRKKNPILYPAAEQ